MTVSTQSVAQDAGNASACSRWAWCGAAVLVVGIFLAYQPAWGAGFIWDDDAHLTAHKCIVGPLGFAEIWTTAEANYFPLVLTTFWVLNKIFGLDPMVFHLTGIALHAACALMLWRVLRQLRVPGAWFGAALWAFHPVQVESVAWVSEIINTQSGLFFLLSVSFALMWVDATDGSARPRSRYYALALLCGAAALTSKPSTVGLPVVLGLCAWWRRGRLTWRDALWLWPFFALALGVSAWTIWEQKHHSGALGAEWNQTFLERLAIAGRVPWFYLGKLLWPEPLIFVYPRWTISPLSIGAFAPLAALAAGTGCVWWWRRRRLAQAVAVAAVFTIVMHFPILGFFNVYYFRYSYVADHFQYLASMGPLVLMGALASSSWGLAADRAARPALVVAAGAIIAALALRTTGHARVFKDSTTLWRETLRENSRAFLALNNLGVAQLEQRNFVTAAEYFERSLIVNPSAAETHFNLGKAFAGQGRTAEAIRATETALQLNPNLAIGHLNLANLLAGIPQRREEAIARYRRALELSPDDADAHSNLSVVLGSQPGGARDALAHGEMAARLNPASATVHLNLGVLLAREPARRAEAIRHYQEAIRLKPDYAKAHLSLGLALAETPGQLDAAIRAYRDALRHDPASAVAHNNLAVAFAQQERWGEAHRHLERAVAIDPNYADARGNLEAVKARLDSGGDSR